MADTSELSKTEKHRRELLEDIVDRGLSGFVEVGEALTEIRDTKLYRDEQKTFEEYCTARFKISIRRAFQLIDAAEVNKDISKPSVKKLPKSVQLYRKRQVSEKPKTESIARELVSVPSGKRSEVWEDVVATAPKYSNGQAKITAAHVKSVVKKPPSPLDESGQPITEETRPAFDARAEFDHALNLMRELVTVLNPLLGDPRADKKPLEGGEFLAKHRQELLSVVKQARNYITFAKPYAHCPYPHNGKKCPACFDLGWLPKEHYERAPREYRGAK